MDFQLVIIVRHKDTAQPSLKGMSVFVKKHQRTIAESFIQASIQSLER